MPLAVLYYNLLISRGKSGTYMCNIICQGLTIIALLCSIKFFGWHLSFSIGAVDIHLSGIRLMVVSYVAMYIVWMLIWHHFVKRETGLRLRYALKDTVPFMGAAAVTMALTWLITKNIGNIYILLGLRILIATVIYLMIIWLSGAKILRESLEYLRHKKRS